MYIFRLRTVSLTDGQSGQSYLGVVSNRSWGGRRKLGFEVFLCRLQSLTVHCVHIRVNG